MDGRTGAEAASGEAGLPPRRDDGVGAAAPDSEDDSESGLGFLCQLKECDRHGRTGRPPRLDERRKDLAWERTPSSRDMSSEATAAGGGGGREASDDAIRHVAVIGSGMEAVACAHFLRKSLPKSVFVVYFALSDNQFGPYHPLLHETTQQHRGSADRMPVLLDMVQDAEMLGLASDLKQPMDRIQGNFRLERNDEKYAEEGGMPGDRDPDGPHDAYTEAAVVKGLQALDAFVHGVKDRVTPRSYSFYFDGTLKQLEADKEPIARYKAEKALALTLASLATEGLQLGRKHAVPPELLQRTKSIRLLVGKEGSYFRLRRGVHSMMKAMLRGIDVRPVQAVRSLTVREDRGKIEVNDEAFDKVAVVAPAQMLLMMRKHQRMPAMQGPMLAALIAETSMEFALAVTRTHVAKSRGVDEKKDEEDKEDEEDEEATTKKEEEGDD